MLRLAPLIALVALPSCKEDPTCEELLSQAALPMRLRFWRPQEGAP